MSSINVISIFGETVEYLDGKELMYLSIDDFTEQYGEEALYGEN